MHRQLLIISAALFASIFTNTIANALPALCQQEEFFSDATIKDSVRVNESVCAITVVKLNGSDFTFGNPPNGTVRVDQVLCGPNVAHELNLKWPAPILPLCGNDTDLQKSIRWWNARPFNGIANGNRYIAALETRNNETFVTRSIPFSQDTATSIQASVKKWTEHWAARKAAIQKVDINKLVAQSTDIVACTPYEMHEHGNTLTETEFLKSSMQNRDQRITITLASDELRNNYENSRKFILFLKASPTAYKWQPPTGYPKALPGVSNLCVEACHIPFYRKLAYIYRPIDDPMWFIPNTPENMQRVKTAISNQKVDVSGKGMTHHDEILEITQAMCFLEHTRRSKYVSSRDKPFTPAELKEREKLIRKTILKLQTLLGKDNYFVMPLYSELGETLRRQGRQTEGAQANKEPENIRRRLYKLSGVNI